MRTTEFKAFPEQQNRSEKGIRFRVGKAQWAMRSLEMNMEDIVRDDDIMYDSLIRIRAIENRRHGTGQNAMRKYYEFVNGRKFPRLKDYLPSVTHGIACDFVARAFNAPYRGLTHILERI